LRAKSQLIWPYYPSLYRHKEHRAEVKISLHLSEIKP